MRRTTRLHRGAGLLLLGLLIVALAGCYRGRPKEKSPIHLNPDMDYQPKVEAQEASPVFEDRSGMRPPVEGTVARGELHEDSRYWRGTDPVTGDPVGENPVPLTAAGLERGQERYNIYCSVCHSRVGDGKGIILDRGYVPPTDLHTEMARNFTDGHIFQVISDGIRNMPGYSAQIPVEDRWLIVHYVRALQRSQHADYADVPEELRDRLR